jgi:hypothetical protein
MGRIGENRLQLGEEAVTSREGQGHAAQFSNEALPFAAGGAPLVGRDGSKEQVETFNSVGREGDGAGDRVNEPSQNQLSGGPVGIAKEKFLNRVGLFAKRVVVGRERTEDSINASKEGAADVVTLGEG